METLKTQIRTTAGDSPLEQFEVVTGETSKISIEPTLNSPRRYFEYVMAKPYVSFLRILDNSKTLHYEGYDSVIEARKGHIELCGLSIEGADKIAKERSAQLLSQTLIKAMEGK
ncbi:hypothetical protein KA107_02405 [Candidatus Pacearchaeota archaeon]|nr:hypothetical protein [Candidatus Pacearchaeota archaeon]